jgi:TonB-dependent SusC/RagA subfamily outer membrane receptor
MLGFRALTQVTQIGVAGVQLMLSPVAISIEQVVITGTAGATEKRTLGNAVSRIDATQVVKTEAITDVGKLLQSRAAGVGVSEQMGVAGGGSRILIRGPGSLAFNGNPIVYVDGVRINNVPNNGPSYSQAGGAGAPSAVSRLNDINPNDIESVEIIKGPAAATLYGTEAAAGVIQIITKRGQSGKPKVNVGIRGGANWFNDAANRIPVPFGRLANGTIVSHNYIQEDAAAGKPDFITGKLQSYNLSVSGGSDAMQYYSGLEYQRDEGFIPQNTSNRASGRLNLTLRPSEKLDANLGVGLEQGTTYLYHALYVGSFIYGQPAYRDTPGGGYLVAPVEAWRDLYHMPLSVNRAQGTITLNHRPTSWLTHRFTVGQDRSDQNQSILVPVMPAKYIPYFGPTGALGFKSVDRITTTYTTVDYSATASFHPSTRLGSNTSVGAQYYKTYFQTENLSGQQFPAPGVETISGTALRTASDNFVDNITAGGYLQQQFSLNDRLFLTGGLRADANSAFGSSFKTVRYPKVSASWVISDEPFWRASFINQLKLRGAWGESGLQPASFAAIRTYAPISGENDAPAGTPQSPGNPTLGPERSAEVELGFEANMLHERLGFDFTYYSRRTRDLILQTNVAPSLGYSGTQYINAGVVTNRGFELLTRVRPVVASNVTWDLTLNLSKNRNEVVDLGPGVTFLATGWIPNRHQVGFPLNGYFRKKIVSADVVNGAAVNAMCDGGTGKQGLESGGAPVPCAQAPRLYLGHPYPDWNSSLMSNVTLFRNWRVATTLDGRFGGAMFESLNYWNCAALLNHEIDYYPERFSNPRVAECQLGLDYIGTSRIQSTNFIKLRELSLTYELPAGFNRLAFGSTGATITLAGRNLHTWTKYDGLDPETFTPVNYMLSAHTELIMPLPRTFLVSLNLGY